MAIDEADGSGGGEADGAVDSGDANQGASERQPATVGEYTWADYLDEYGPDGGRGSDRWQASDLKHPMLTPESIDVAVKGAKNRGTQLADLAEKRTVEVNEDLDEDAFFSTQHGTTTVVNRYDLEKAVPMEKKLHFSEEERYWVNKPYAFVIVFHSSKENEKKYYLVEPYLNSVETSLEEYLTGKLRTAIKYSDDELAMSEDGRRQVIEDETLELLDRYDLYDRPGNGGNGGGSSFMGRMRQLLGQATEQAPDEIERAELEGISARPEPAIVEEDSETLNEYQVEKLLYFLKRDFIGYERIDGIKHDINVEDISCDGYNSPVFVYHSEYEQLITNIYHGEEELDDFVVKLAQRSGKGISKRRPQVDATLPDGSRAQLTLGKEVSDHGTNYTIRQFKDVPFTPIDLINWKTFSLDEIGFLWICIENNKSLLFAGGTASGKTTSLNAVSLFIPSNAKIVSIEDTREVELPQRNWIASVTRPSFAEDDKGDVDEFDLLEAALRQRPEYIVMGEIRGEEGRTLFQVMSTGHTTLTTFHADSVGEVLKRFTTEPINVSKTMFTALDLVSIQSQTRIRGRKVRRNKVLTEINYYDPENDEINVQDIFQWQAETDEFLRMSDSNTLEDIKFDRGWTQSKLEEEIFKRQVVLAYLVKHGLNTYTQVAATIQGFMNDEETILRLMANGQLEQSLEDLREMESVLIDIDPEKEEMVPRPDPSDEMLAEAEGLLERAEDELFEDFRGEPAGSVASTLEDMQPAASVDDEPELEGEPTPELGERPADVAVSEFPEDSADGDETEVVANGAYPDDEEAEDEDEREKDAKGESGESGWSGGFKGASPAEDN